MSVCTERENVLCGFSFASVILVDEVALRINSSREFCVYGVGYIFIYIGIYRQPALMSSGGVLRSVRVCTMDAACHV